MPGNTYLIVPVHVISTWSRYKQVSKRSVESGGIILGFRRHLHIQVVSVTQPSRGDKQGRFFFDRASKIHRRISSKRWFKSKGYMDYLGEWHTHPEPIPRPSKIDTTNLSRMYGLRQNKNMLSVIIGINEIWVGLYNKGALVTLNEIDQNRIRTI